ncbi:MAG: CBS domain-containing protein [Desulfovibrionaceae bacterium]
MSKKKKKERVSAPVVITAHVNADFDSLAAMIAASKLYEGAVLIFPGSQEKNLRNFFIQSTTYLFNFKNFKEIDPDSVQTLVVVDTRQKSRLSHVAPLLERDDVKIHTYDHHPDSDEDIQAERSVYKPWGSCSAIIVHEMMDDDPELTEEEATIMGLGIFEDTGSFTFNSTTPHDFAAAAWLRAKGMDLDVISDLISRDLTAQQVSILNDLIQSAKTHDINGVDVVLAETSSEEFIPDFALLAHKLLDMENIRVLFALGRMSDRIHMVARSRNPDVDVGSICAFFGGGGHAYAASSTVKDRTLAEVKDELFALLYSHVNPKRLVEHFMSTPVVAIPEDAPMREAMEVMTRYGIQAVPVLSPGSEKCVGVLEHKIADKAVTHGLDDVPVEVYMQRDVASVDLSAGLYQVMEIILGQKQRLVPVVDKARMVGVVTRTDLVNVLISEPARIPEALTPEKRRERSISSLMRNRLPRRMLDILQAAGELGREQGVEVYAVGGFVRDILMHAPNLDLDLVVEGDGVAFGRAMAERMGGRAKTHQKFKTAVVVLEDGQRVDVATARLEYYEYPAALPTVELSSIKMDLYRRDFTINALAVHINPDKFGSLVDFFGAQRDIKDRVLRVLHSLSFVEDPTRILRAVRFEQRFKFTIGGQTLRLIKNALALKIFDRLSGNRIFNELKLIMQETSPLACLRRLKQLGVLGAIHPFLKLDTAREKILAEVERVYGGYKLLFQEYNLDQWKLYMLGLTHGLNLHKLEQVFRRFNLSRREEREMTELRGHIFQATHDLGRWRNSKGQTSRLYFILEPVPLEGVLYLMARTRDEKMRKSISLYLTQLKDHTLDIRGEDLMAMDIPPGPVYSRILRKVRAAKLDGLAKTRDAQLELAKRLYREIDLGEDEK